MTTYYTDIATLALTSLVGDMVKFESRVTNVKFKYTVPAATLAIGSVIRLFKLPPGDVVFLPVASRIQWTAGGASLTADIGYEAYTGYDGAAVAASAAYFDDDIALTSAGEAAMGSDLTISVTTTTTGQYKEFASKNGVWISLTTAGLIAPAAMVIQGYAQWAK